jgi:hypothetical protein
MVVLLLIIFMVIIGVIVGDFYDDEDINIVLESLDHLASGSFNKRK